MLTPEVWKVASPAWWNEPKDRAGHSRVAMRTSRASIVTLCYYDSTVVYWICGMAVGGSPYCYDKPLQALGLGGAREQRRSTA